MKKTTAIKQFRFISPQCPSLGQSTVPDGGKSTLLLPCPQGAWLPARLPAQALLSSQ